MGGGVNVTLFLGLRAGFLLRKTIQKSVFLIKFSFINVTKPET